jgi:hypothetical protein
MTWQQDIALSPRIEVPDWQATDKLPVHRTADPSNGYITLEQILSGGRDTFRALSDEPANLTLADIRYHYHGAYLTVEGSTILPIAEVGATAVFTQYGDQVISLQAGTGQFFEKAASNDTRLVISAGTIVLKMIVQDVWSVVGASVPNGWGIETANYPNAQYSGITTLAAGTATVVLSDLINQTLSDTYPIMLTSNADERLRYSSRTSAGFTITSSNGSSTSEVSWRIY